MARTVMPFSFVLQREHHAWRKFREKLSKEDKEAFDRLFDRAKFHTAAAVYMSHDWPMETILLSILLEHEKMITEMEVKIDTKENSLNGWNRYFSGRPCRNPGFLVLFRCNSLLFRFFQTAFRHF